MARLDWNAIGDNFYSAGVDRGVLYPKVGPGVPWNGLLSVNEASTGSEERVYFQDGRKFQVDKTPESYTATITAITYPEELNESLGVDGFLTNQRKETFGFSYRNVVGSDTQQYYQIHLVYNAEATIGDLSYNTINSTTAITPFSISIETMPEILWDGRKSAHLIIDSRVAYSWAIEALENVLYGDDENEARLPTVDEVLHIFEDASILKITDHGDGSWTAEGPDEAITMLDSTSFEITWPSAVYVDEVTYTISSL